MQMSYTLPPRTCFTRARRSDEHGQVVAVRLLQQSEGWSHYVAKQKPTHREDGGDHLFRFGDGQRRVRGESRRFVSLGFRNAIKKLREEVLLNQCAYGEII